MSTTNEEGKLLADKWKRVAVDLVAAIQAEKLPDGGRHSYNVEHAIDAVNELLRTSGHVR